MLTDDPKRLRFFGIDLHSRGRRRVIVALTYVVYVFAMAAVEVAFDAKQEFLRQNLSLFLVSFGVM